MMTEALVMWWHAVVWLWGWASVVIVPVLVYKGMIRLLRFLNP